MKQSKLHILVFLICLLFSLHAGSPVVYAQVTPPPMPLPEGVIVPPGDELPLVTAKSAIVMEAATGRILYSRNMDERHYPASTTKIMTLIIALEQGNLDDIVTVSHRASGTEGSTIWLEPDEKIRFLDLLYGMMLVSGNDATVAVAEHIAGSVPAFARLMTDKAHAIGAVNTSFVNSSGLPDEQHYTTAHDMAMIAAYGYKNSMFEHIVSTKEKNIPWAGHPTDRELRNENQMLWLYDGGNGVKTGYTDAAGRCLVAAAKRNGVQLITVVLDSVYMWNDSIAMLNYGFERVHPVQLIEKGQVLKTVQVLSGKQKQLQLKTAEAVSVPVTDPEEMGKFKQVISAPERISAGIREGDIIGRLSVQYEGREVASVNLVAAETIEKKSFFALLYKTACSIFHYLV